MLPSKSSTKLYFLVSGFLLLLFLFPLTAAAKSFKIGILLWHETDHDNQSLAGFQSGISLTGVNAELDIKRAYSSEEKSRIFLKQWRASGIDLVVAVGTKSSIWALEELPQTPIVFLSVSNPVLSGIANSWESSGKNITGTSSYLPPRLKITSFKECVPSLKKLGVIFNPNNPVSSLEVREIERTGAAMGVALIKENISAPEHISSAIQNLIGRIDALWLPREGELLSQNLDIISHISMQHKLPVLASDKEFAIGENTPAILAVDIDHKSLGRLSVSAVLAILLKNIHPQNIPIQQASFQQTLVNLDRAEAIGYIIPPLVIGKAHTVIKNTQKQTLTISGTGDSQGLLRVLADSFQELHPLSEIIVPDSIGSTGGIKSLLEGTSVLARIARPLTDQEVMTGVKLLLFAQSPVVFATNKAAGELVSISEEQLVAIYQGKLTRWQELNIQKKLGKIYPVSREEGDSSLSAIQKIIPQFSRLPQNISKIIYTTPKTSQTLQSYKRVIGYLPLAVTLKTDLNILNLNGVTPSAENILSGKYKITVPFGIAYKAEPTGLAKLFIDFLFSNQGVQIINSHGAIAVPRRIEQ